MNEFNEFENIRGHKLDMINNYEKKNLNFETNLNTTYTDKEIIKERILNLNGEVKIIIYLKGKFIGKGGFAKCYELMNLETYHMSAVKIIEKSTLDKSRSKQKLISEIKIHRGLDYPHIVKFEHFFEDSDNIYLLLEICPNQSLNELLKRRKRLTEFEAQYYLYQTLLALKYLHSQKVIHRDLKLGNLFIAEKMHLKIGDFGLATKIEYDEEQKRTMCGTPNYIAPEILEGKKGHSYQVDIWSIGIILYALLVAKPPFESKDVKATYKRIKAGIYHFPENVEIIDYAKVLIKDILVPDPLKRPTIELILKSEFFQVGSIPKLMPMSTLACPPNLSYIKKFWPDASHNGMAYFSNIKKRLSRGSSIDSINIKTEYDENIYFKGNHQKARQDEIENIRKKYIEVAFFNGKTETPMLTIEDTKSVRSIQQQRNNINEIILIKNAKDEINVIKWLDYSNKYGIGYLLSNDSIGVYFNDSTKIVLDPDGQVFHYIEKKEVDRQEVMSVYSLDKYPEYLNKKVTLLNRFKNNLNILYHQKSFDNSQYENHTDNKIQSSINCNIENIRSLDFQKKLKKKSNEFVYVKKWMVTKNSIIFRLSNKIIQFCFFDQTQIMLNSNKKQVIYANKDKKRITFPLNNAMNVNNPEMNKRLKYVKDLLSHMLSVHPSSNLKSKTDKNLIVKNFDYSLKNPNNNKSFKLQNLDKNCKTLEDHVIKEKTFRDNKKFDLNEWMY